MSTTCLYFRSKAPTARLRLAGIAVTTLEKSGEHVKPEQKQYIVLSKRRRTKLVLNPDSAPEFHGWLKTLNGVTEKLNNSKLHSIKDNSEEDTNQPYMNVDEAITSRGRSKVKSHGKAPIPTPRSKTPSREESSVSNSPAAQENKAMENILGDNQVNRMIIFWVLTLVQFSGGCAVSARYG